MENQSSKRIIIIVGIVLVLIIGAFFLGRSVRDDSVVVPIAEIPTSPSDGELPKIELVESDSDVDTDSQENITTPLYVKSVYQKNNRWWADVDYITHLSGIDFLEYQIDAGKCFIPGKSKETLLAEAYKYASQGFSDGENEEDIPLFTNQSCLGSWITLEFGNDINQSSQLRSFPFSTAYEVVNDCSTGIEFTPAEIAKHIARNTVYQYGFYTTSGGFRVPRAIIADGQIQVFDFLYGCAN